MSILIAGGTGYIGSHVVVELLNNNFKVVVIDNFSNSKPQVLNNIKKITGKNFKFYEADYSNRDMLEKIFKENTDIDSVINFVGFKAIEASIKYPLDYYINNVSGVLVLLDIMKKFNIKKFIYSSSATVYGKDNKIPYEETMKIGQATNPYGNTKIITEKILEDIYNSDDSWNIIILRYFNPIGAHESGLIGENPKGIPSNLMPYIIQVATGKLKELSIFGNDYNTPDGTCIRDYIHVVDLAKGHVKALEKLMKNKNGINIYNLGTGKGYSVLEVLHTFENVTKQKIKYKITKRREGDLGMIYSNSEKAEKELQWKAEKTLEEMCRDSWNYIIKNK